MDSDSLLHNRQLGNTWGLRLGQYINADLLNRAREGRVGILQNGDFIPLPQPKGCSSVLPDTVPVGNTFNPPVNLPRNLDQKKVLDLAIPNDRLVSGVLPLFETFPVVGNGVRIEGEGRDTVWASASSFTSGKDSDLGAKPGRGATLLDATLMSNLLFYLSKHEEVSARWNEFGCETAKGRDIPRDSTVVVTQINTFDSATLNARFLRPLPDHTRFGRALFEETVQSGRGRCHFSGSAPEAALLAGAAKRVFPLSRPRRVGVGDAAEEPAPLYMVWPGALEQNALSSSASGSSASACANMFIHYVKAMERLPMWKRGMDAALDSAADMLSYAARTTEYRLNNMMMVLGWKQLGESSSAPLPLSYDYFPLDVLLKYMLDKKPQAEVAVASTMQLLEIFEDEDKIPVAAEDILSALKKIKPLVRVQDIRGYSVALLYRPASNTARPSTIPDAAREESLYEADLLSKSEKCGDDCTCTEVDTVSVISEKSGRWWYSY